MKFSGITWTHDSKGFFYQVRHRVGILRRVNAHCGVSSLQRFGDRQSHGSASEDKAGTETESDKNAMLYYHKLGTSQCVSSVRFLLPLIDIRTTLPALRADSGGYSGLQGSFEPRVDVGHSDYGSRRSLPIALCSPRHVASAYSLKLATHSPVTLIASFPCDRKPFCGSPTSKRTRLDRTWCGIRSSTSSRQTMNSEYLGLKRAACIRLSGFHSDGFYMPFGRVSVLIRA